MTLRQHVRAVLSDENRHFTRENLGLDREPTADELCHNYERYQTLMTVVSFQVSPITEDDSNEHLFV